MAEKDKKLTLWQAFKSVAASAFGVQSQQNLSRDFNQPSPLTFIVIGIVFVALFVVALASFVSLL